ncbi:MAG: glycosyltransferase, partial [Patescibacteria group bacterium]
MKVLQVNKLYPPVTGGIEQHVKQLAEGWTAHGESRVLVVRDGFGWGDEKIESGVTVRRGGSIGRFRSMPISLTFWYWLWRESARADAVHLHFPFPLAAFSWWLVRPKKPLIVTWHSAIVRQRILGRLTKPFVRYTLRRAEKIVVTFPQAPEVFEELREWRDKCQVIPLGIDSAWWGAPPLRAAERPSVPLFVYAGRLVYYKGLPVLIEAAARLRT